MAQYSPGDVRRSTGREMRSNNTVANTVAIDSHALGTLNYIRASIDASTAFAVPGTAGIAMGVVGVAAAVLASLPALAPYWIAIWLVAAALGSVIGGVLIARHPSRGTVMLYRGPARRFGLCLCPALMAGAILTAVLWQAGETRLLAGAWLLLYGCAVLSASMMTSTAIVRLIAAMGALFVILGVIAFELSLEWHNLVLGLGFGAVHLVFGVLIRRIDQGERAGST
jgi:hypothetical protein